MLFERYYAKKSSMPCFWSLNNGRHRWPVFRMSCHELRVPWSFLVPPTDEPPCGQNLVWRTRHSSFFSPAVCSTVISSRLAPHSPACVLTPALQPREPHRATPVTVRVCICPLNTLNTIWKQRRGCLVVRTALPTGRRGQITWYSQPGSAF